jgi:hypothetical protein
MFGGATHAIAIGVEHRVDVREEHVACDFVVDELVES